MTISKKLPLLYTHPIGSLPRPQAVRDLLRGRDESPHDPTVQRALDDCVRFAIRLQEIAGLDVVSDGEWRRTQYIQEFLNRAGGFENCRSFEHQGEVKTTKVVVRRMPTGDPVFAEDARFLVANTDRCTKFALPSPFLIAVRYWHEDYSRDAYPTAQHFMDHLTEILTKEARVLAEVGIDIIQLDDPALTYYCDPNLMAGTSSHDQRLHRMWDANREVPAAVDAINQIADGLQAEVHLHSCHSGGVQRLGVERVALNPDCGFAPDAGEPPTVDEAYQKLCRLTEVAQRLRGELLCG